MKTTIANILIFLFIATWGGMLGYIWYDTTRGAIQDLGGVRSESTGFWMAEGEQFGIGTSTVTANYDITVLSSATSTIYLGKDQTATTTGNCIIGDDMDGVGTTYCYFNNGAQTCSSTDICF